MDPTGIATKTAESLLENGVFGTLAVVLLLLLAAAGWVIRRLYNDNQVLHSTFTARLAEAVVALNGSTVILQEMKGTIAVLNGTVTVLTASISELSRETANQDKEIRHGLNGVGMSLQSNAGQLEKIKDAINTTFEKLLARLAP